MKHGVIEDISFDSSRFRYAAPGFLSFMLLTIFSAGGLAQLTGKPCDPICLQSFQIFQQSFFLFRRQIDAILVATAAIAGFGVGAIGCGIVGKRGIGLHGR